MLTLLALGLLVRLTLAALVPLLEAEAYYWLWSRDLAWGYFDHPPGVAVLIRAATSIAGDSALGVRLGHVLLPIAGSWVVWRLARECVGPRAAVATLAVHVFAPFWAPLNSVATPDGPLLFMWSLTLLLVWRAWQGERTGTWLLAGLATGLTILCKYNGVQLPGVTLLFLLSTPRGRAWLRRPGPWLALALALVVIAPNAWWNVSHSGDTVARPFSSGGTPAEIPQHIGLLLLLPLLLLTPPLGWRWYRVSVARARDRSLVTHPGLLFLAVASWVPMLAFVGVACVTEIHAHWVATCFVTAVPLTCACLDLPGTGPGGESIRRAIRSGALFIGLGTALALLVVPVLATRGLEHPRRAMTEITGWDELRGRLTDERARRGDFTLAALNYHLVAKAQWLTGGELPGLPLESKQLHQYRHWLADEQPPMDAVMVINKTGRSADKLRFALETRFASIAPLAPVMVGPDGEQTPRFELWWCEEPRAGD